MIKKLMKLKMKINKIVVVCSLIVLLSSIFSLKLRAEGGITLSPSNFEVTTIAPNSFSKSFSVTNNEKSDINLKIYSAELKDNLVDEKSDIAAWVKPKINSLTLKSLQSDSIDFDIAIPSSAKPDVYHLAIILELNFNSITNSPVVLKVPFLIDIIVNSSSKSETGNVIGSFEVDKKIVFDDKIDFSFNVKNDSNVVVTKPIIYFQIVNPSGKIIYSKIFNESLKELTGSDLISETVVNPKFKLNNIFDVGQYRAELMVIDSLSTKRVVAKLTFVAIPYENIIYLITLIFTIIVLVKIIHTRKNLTLLNIKPQNKGLGRKLMYRRNSAKK